MKNKLSILSFICSVLFHDAVMGVPSPYAPSSVGTNSAPNYIAQYAYDSASNRLSNGHGQAITMGLISKPETITTDSGTETFFHGVGERRRMRVHADGRKTFYLDGAEYRISASGEATMVVQIHAKGYSPDLQVNATDVNNLQYIYLLKDHLGSPVLTVDDSGAAQDPSRFDPWGQMTDASGVAEIWSTPAEVKTAEKIRRFTGHELIASANLTHMNGRIFDQEIGLPLGPDIFIQGSSLASVNRFALGNNRSPNFTDPSGWQFFSEIDHVTRNETSSRALNQIRRRGTANLHQNARNLQRNAFYGAILENTKDHIRGSQTDHIHFSYRYEPAYRSREIGFNFRKIAGVNNRLIYEFELKFGNQHIAPNGQIQDGVHAMVRARQEEAILFYHTVERASDNGFRNVFSDLLVGHGFTSLNNYRAPNGYSIRSFHSFYYATRYNRAFHYGAGGLIDYNSSLFKVLRGGSPADLNDLARFSGMNLRQQALVKAMTMNVTEHLDGLFFERHGLPDGADL